MFVFAFSVQAMTKSELKDIVQSDTELRNQVSKLNSVLAKIPGNLVGKDEVYHARIGYDDVGLILRDGLVDTIHTGRPSNPTYMVVTDYDTLLALANSENPAPDTIQAITDGRIFIYKAPACSDDLDCRDNQVCTSGGCKDAFTVAVVPIAYGRNELAGFLEKAVPEMDLFKLYLPIDKKYMRIHYVDPKVCPDYKCNDVCRDCQTVAQNCARNAGLLGYADKIFGVSRDDVKVDIGGGNWMLLCGCAGGIPSLTSVSRARKYVGGGVYCYNTVPHEAGHQLGLWHIDATGEEAGACRGPNAADCSESDKMTDIMGYAWPQDHFGPAANRHLKGLLGHFEV